MADENGSKKEKEDKGVASFARALAVSVALLALAALGVGYGVQSGRLILVELDTSAFNVDLGQPMSWPVSETQTKKAR